MQEAIFYREHYYLLPPQYDNFYSFRESMSGQVYPIKVVLTELCENYHVGGYVEKGISFAPYFISGYFWEPQMVEIKALEEVYPVTVEVLTQDEYNARLRQVVCEHCPGCAAYKPLTKNVRSLNGHFNEISLNKVCFVRYETKPSPRYFRSLLWSAGGLWQHRPPQDKTAGRIAENIKSWLYMKYDTAEFSPSDSNILLVSHKKDFFLSILTSILGQYMESWLYYTQVHVEDTDKTPISEADILAVIANNNVEKFRKECKKYGVSIGVLEYSAQAQDEIERSLADPIWHNLFYPIYTTEGKTYYMFTDTPYCLKELHFRFPMLERHHATITVYSQYDVKKYQISKDMPYTIESD